MGFERPSSCPPWDGLHHRSFNLETLGFETDTIERFKKLIRQPSGLILLNGPTGSGKTTTLYATVNEISTPDVNVITVEDPVEYQIKGINQIQVSEKSGLTFAKGLRAILRHDPDVVLIGEIRDEETARIAIQASLTGHLVFSTLHTNDAPATVTRLKDMGIQPFMICATVEAILAQRLVRRICTKCREETKVSTSMLADLGMKTEDIAGKKFFKGTGCDNCNNTGYKGRIALFELMILNDKIRDMVLGNASTDELRELSLIHI